MKRLRRSMMFIPGNNPNKIINAPVYGPDCIILDLEDAVSVNQKDAARHLVVEALKTLDFCGCEKVVRINALSTPYGEQDIVALTPALPDALRVPMCQEPGDVEAAAAILEREEIKHGIPPGTIKLMAAIETVTGVLNAVKISTASPRLVAMSFGAEDFCTSIGAERSRSGEEIFWARNMVLMAAKAAGLDAIDTVFSDIKDDEGFIKEAEFVKKMGFSGKAVIHPRQVKLLHRVFTPNLAEIEKAKRILIGIKEAEASGSGVIAVDGKMVDAPIVARARRVIELAKAAGALVEGDDLLD